MKSLQLLTGINRRLIVCIRESIHSFNQYEKDAILIWDEMRTKEHIEYDKNTDMLYGILDHGEDFRELIAAKEALVFMVKGLTGHWAFPLAYYFSPDSTETTELVRILDEVLNELENLGIQVRVCISDMGFTNQGFFRNLGISETRPYIDRCDRRIYFIYDPCHLIKLVRTHLQKKTGIRYSGGVALWEHLLCSYEYDSRTENRLMPKLTNAHFELTDKTRMKVKLATQVLSHSVYAGIKTLVESEVLDEDAMESATFVKKNERYVRHHEH